MYIPKSNIVEVGYTYGGEFLFPSNQFYVGAWHKDKFGAYWSGETHTGSSTRLTHFLTPIPDDPSEELGNYKFKEKLNISLDNRSFNDDYIQPTENDYTRGYFTRYIAKVNSTSQIQFIEINETHFNDLNRNPTPLYTPISLVWKLIGVLNDIYDNNVRIESGVKDTNLRSIQNAEKTISGLSNYLNDPLQYTRIISNLASIDSKIVDFGVIREEIDMSIVNAPPVNITPTPSITPSVTPSISETPSMSVTPSVSITPSINETPSITPSVSNTPNISETPSVSITPSISATPSISVTPNTSIDTSVSMTPTITVTPSVTRTPSVTPSVTVTPSITRTPSVTPTVSVTATPSVTTTPSITPSITLSPTPSPSTSPGDCEIVVNLNVGTGGGGYITVTNQDTSAQYTITAADATGVGYVPSGSYNVTDYGLTVPCSPPLVITLAPSSFSGGCSSTVYVDIGCN